MDNLGIAQYLSRLGLLLGDTEALDAGKQAWLNGAAWQPLRQYVEDCLVVRDPIELFVAQNLALDGLLYPLIYERIVDQRLSAAGGSAVAMLCQFMNDWFDETRKWIDAVLKTAAAESAHNRDTLAQWTRHWMERAVAAVSPIVEQALGADTGEVVEEYAAALEARIKKTGIAL
jgi:phenol hydroxylase P1 protein